MKNHRAIALITDTIRTVMTTTIAPHELEALIDSELEAHHEELLTPSSAVNFVADCLPGLGIVAAVLGVVLTMGKISEPPEVSGTALAPPRWEPFWACSPAMDLSGRSARILNTWPRKTFSF